MHLLAVHQVARILVSDPQCDPSGGRAETQLHQEFRGIFDRSRESGARLAPLRVIAELELVLLHVRATARGVDDDGIELQAGKRIHGARREPLRRLRLASMRSQGTAAEPRVRHDHVATVARQGKCGAPIRAMEHLVLDAPGQQADAGAACSLRRG